MTSKVQLNHVERRRAVRFIFHGLRCAPAAKGCRFHRSREKNFAGNRVVIQRIDAILENLSKKLPHKIWKSQKWAYFCTRN